MPCAGRVTPLEETIRIYADKPSEILVRPKIGMSFDSLGEVYDFCNLYSWELGLVYDTARVVKMLRGLNVCKRLSADAPSALQNSHKDHYISGFLNNLDHYISFF